jgi:hypothetical protein
MLIVPPVAVIIAQAYPTASPTAAATTPADAAVAARAKDWLHQIQSGKIDRSQLDDKMNAALTDTKLAQVSTQVAPLGDPSSFTLYRKVTNGSLSIYVYQVVFPSMTLYETFAFDADGKIAGLLLTPQNPVPPR